MIWKAVTSEEVTWRAVSSWVAVWSLSCSSWVFISHRNTISQGLTSQTLQYFVLHEISQPEYWTRRRKKNYHKIRYFSDFEFHFASFFRCIFANSERVKFRISPISYIAIGEICIARRLAKCENSQKEIIFEISPCRNYENSPKQNILHEISSFRGMPIVRPFTAKDRVTRERCSAPSRICRGSSGWSGI